MRHASILGIALMTFGIASTALAAEPDNPYRAWEQYDQQQRAAAAQAAQTPAATGSTAPAPRMRTTAHVARHRAVAHRSDGAQHHASVPHHALPSHG